MAIQTSLGRKLIVSEIFRRYELVPCVFYEIPSFGDDSSPRGVALKTGSLVCWMSVGVSPHLSNLRMALSADTLICCGVTYEIRTYASAADQDKEYEKAEENPAFLFVFGRRHFSFISYQFGAYKFQVSACPVEGPRAESFFH